MIHNKKFRASFTFLLVFMLVLTSFTSFAAGPNTDNNISLDDIMSNIAETNVNPEVKIKTDVKEAFNENEYVEVLVELNEKVDAVKVANEAVNRLMTMSKVQPTAYNKKMTSRYAIVNSLKATAERTQKGILEYLNIEKKKGNVEEIESYHIVNMVYVKATKDIIENLSKRLEVKNIHLNKTHKIDFAEVSSLNLNTEDPSITWGVDRVRAPQVWEEFGIDGSGIVVGIIDTGLEWNHPALREHWRGYLPHDPKNPNVAGNWYDPVTGSEMPYDEPSIPHGSHVAGSIVGQDADGEYKIGVAPGAKFITAKAFTADGGTDVDLIAAGEWMLAPDGDPSLAPDIINNSWGGGNVFDEWYKEIVVAWREAGILPVFAAGNSSEGYTPGTISTPANYPESFAVGAIDIENKKGEFSSEGPGPEEYGDLIKPDIAAPGVSILSSVPTDKYEAWNGTSMATPHVSGVAALILQANYALTVDELEDLMIDTATPLTDDYYTETPNYGYGYGLVDAYTAVSGVATGFGTISGNVMTESDDTTAPEIIHEPVDFSYGAIDIPLEVTVKDNFVINNVEIWIKNDIEPDWIVVPMEKISGRPDFKEGTYQGTIPWMYVQDPGIQYQIKATDYSGNIGLSPMYEMEVTFGITPEEFPFVDFSQDPTELGFIMTGDWEWGTPERDPDEYESTELPEVAEGDKIVGTNLGGRYSKETQSMFILPALDLRNTEEVSLRFKQWYEIYSDTLASIAITTDPTGVEPWNMFENFNGEDGKAWQEFSVSLNEYAGSGKAVFVAFTLTSGPWIQKSGWYFDDIELVLEDNEAPEAPTELTVESDSEGTHLSWTPSTSGDTAGYRILRSTTPGSNYVEIGRRALTATSFTDTDTVIGTPYFYVVKALDFHRNESGYSNEVTAVSINPSPLPNKFYYSDFEDDPGQLIANAVPGGKSMAWWEWGRPLSYYDGIPRAYSGENVWANSLRGYYETLSDFWVETPIFDLGELSNAGLFFMNWYDFEKDFDFGYLQISTDNGVTWEDLETYTGYNGPEDADGFGGTGEWEAEIVSLNDYLGEFVKIRFRVVSDITWSETGWFIDDLIIFATPDNTTSNVLEGTYSVSDIDVDLENVKNTSDTIIKDVPKKEVTPEELEEAKGDSKPIILEHPLRKDPSSYNYYKVSKNEVKESTSTQPVYAIVTAVEMGRSAVTNPLDGSYTLFLPANKEGESYTLIVEAYGYYQDEDQAVVIDKEDTVKNFMLDAIPTGNIEGYVLDEVTGEPVEGAVIKITDAFLTPTTVTNSEGYYTFENMPEDNYNLRIHADHYYTQELPFEIIGNNTVQFNIVQKPLEQIGFDDGTAESALMTLGDGAWLIEIQPEQLVQLKGVNLYIEEEKAGLNSLGRPFQVGVANVDLGELTEYGTRINWSVELAQGSEVQYIEHAGWNFVDLSQLEYSTGEPFYIYVRQYTGWPNDFWIGMDKSSENDGNVWMYFKNPYAPDVRLIPVLPEEDDGSILGRPMIRAVVDTGLASPQITSPIDGTVTTEEAVNVSGTVPADGQVTVSVNGENYLLNSSNNSFDVNVTLAEGENEIKAKLIIEGKESLFSTPITIYKDTTAPVFDIYPVDGFETNREVVDVYGTVTEDHLQSITVNGQSVEFNENGTFSSQVIVNQGENTITVVATDVVGNTATEERTVIVDLGGQPPVLTPPTLTEDTTNNFVGESVDITFTDDAAWRDAITNITVDGETIIGNYTVTEGNININADVFTETKNYTVRVIANGYSDAVVTQVIREELTSGIEIINGENVSHDRPVTIKATASQEVDWEVNIKYPNGALVTTLTHTGATFETTWGPEEARKYNGEYTVEVNEKVDGEVILTEEFKINVYNYPIKINNVVVEERNGIVSIGADMENLGPDLQNPMLVIQVKDEQNRVVSISTAKMDGLFVGQSVTLTSSFIAPEAGTYSVDVFVWTGWNNTEALSSPETETFIIE